MNQKPNTLETPDAQLFFEAVLSLFTIEECKDFFRDLMTEQEIETFAARFKTAVMLSENIPYREIAKRTGMSTATITRINTWLTRGKNGYATAIKKLRGLSQSAIHHHHTQNSSGL